MLQLSLHNGKSKMDMDRTDWDLDFEDDVEETELDDEIELVTLLEAEARFEQH